ncbi:hypothetical protein CBR_g23783 [Chara braunii]|uniref:Uncharacterized protein n=1 Tax=Chara braunii TaxID=69332 RepID=A0A388JVN4_CHABU|nr:hypothetical protein CBR_g23783 [Chara braunii]|eukprot:GBG61827.1 hypothetical protein CBR_g23783 [Chara braunii]
MTGEATCIREPTREQQLKWKNRHPLHSRCTWNGSGLNSKQLVHKDGRNRVVDRPPTGQLECWAGLCLVIVTVLGTTTGPDAAECV